MYNKLSEICVPDNRGNFRIYFQLVYPFIYQIKEVIKDWIIPL